MLHLLVKIEPINYKHYEENTKRLSHASGRGT